MAGGNAAAQRDIGVPNLAAPPYVLPPGGGRTDTDVTEYLLNNAVFNVLDFAPAGVTPNDGTTNAIASITAAATAAGAVGGSIYFPPGTYSIPANLTLAVGVHFAPGAMVSVAATKVLTLNGTIGGVSQQIFAGAGTVAIGKGFVPFVYPQWWGAVGNTVHDDTSAIQAAISTGVASGIEVMVPAGNYNVTATLTVPDFGRVRGAGRQSQGTIFSFTSAALVGFNCGSQVVLQGFAINGSAPVNGIGLQIGTLTIGSTQGVVRDINISGWSGAGGRALSYSGETFLFEACYFSGAETGVYLTGGNRPTNTLFLDCQIRACSLYGLYVDTGYGITFERCLFESNEQYGVYLNANPVPGSGVIRMLQFYACWFENNWTSLAGNPLRLTKYEFQGTAGDTNQIKWLSVRDCQFDNGNDRPLSVYLTNAVGFVFDNNVFNNVANNFKFDGAGSLAGRVNNWDTFVNGDATTVISDVLNVVECDCRLAPWTPVATGLTVVPGTGAATLIGTYTKVGRIVHWTIKIVCTGTATTAATNGVTYFTLPFAVAEYNSFVGSNSDTAAGLAVGHVALSARAYAPTWFAVGGTQILSGWYQSQL
jgi:hypothetical protein